ncbi:MAG TPA: hypothetical protein VLI39_21700 [Sedimentisphaerales bacterium]|nr:hypothetical protein [Sedimentisphaerales bacterium]
MSLTANPAPTSTPLTAPIPSIRPSSASSLSNTGSPRPAGAPSTITSTTPPAESPCRQIALQASSIAWAASMSGQLTTGCTPNRSRISSAAM